MPATEAPFVLQQSGDGENGKGEPTEAPTDEPTETPTPTVSVALDSDLRVGYVLLEYYGEAIEENAARGARGEAHGLALWMHRSIARR